MGHWKLSSEEKTEICELYQKGHTSGQLANQFNVTGPTILSILNTRSIERRGQVDAQWQHKSHLDETAFHHLTPSSLYWLGFVFADGCIIKRHGQSPVLSVSLQNKDKEHLEKLKCFLETSSKIIVRKDTNCNMLTVSSTTLTNKLKEYGIVQRKSLIAKTENNKLLSSKDFWRGMVDGDGSIGSYYAKGGPYPRIKLCGSRDMVTDFGQFVANNIIKHQSSVRKHKSIYVVSFSGTTAIPIIKYLYTNPKVFLNRKMDLAQHILSNFNSRAA